ncbi:MAG TPA: tetratricopeptide repeat protein, partial [Gemmatimonadaceae bacterium]|nr:tetratricopeptide repeat protein [Gemmatimonadaceae bacterium]
SILDEIALGRTNQVDQTTAVRSGRLLQANRLVTGTLSIPNVNNAVFATSVVTVSTSQPAAGGSQTGALARIFDYEKTVVLATLTTLGIRPTPEQTAAIQGNRPTNNLTAFLAYSRGLAASDAGRLDEAAQFFDNAHSIDPGFAAAAMRAANARASSAGAGITTAQIETKLKGSSEGQTVSAAEHGTVSSQSSSSLGTTIQNALADVNPSAADAIGRSSTSASNRDPASSTTAKDQATVKTGTLTIVIKRP